MFGGLKEHDLAQCLAHSAQGYVHSLFPFPSPLPCLCLCLPPGRGCHFRDLQHLRPLSLPTFLSSHRVLQMLLPLAPGFPASSPSMLLCQVSLSLVCIPAALLACLRVVLCSQARCSSASSWALSPLDTCLPSPPSHSDLTWGPSQLRTTDLSKDQVHVTAATKSPQLKGSSLCPPAHQTGGSRNCHHRKGQESERSVEPPPPQAASS